jgi:hypothetical protein
VVIPLFALVPDITINVWQRVLFPTPFDAVMLAEKESNKDLKDKEENQGYLSASQRKLIIPVNILLLIIYFVDVE